MKVNVETIGPAKKVLVVGGRRNLSSALAIALSASHCITLPTLQMPKPAKRLMNADFERIEAAEAKRQRRINRNKKEPRHDA